MHPPVTLVINQAFVEPLYRGTKIAAMAQGSFYPGQKIVFEITKANATVKIAEAIVYGVVGLRISPMREQIERRNSGEWELLNGDATARVLQNEGFEHPNDFWHFAHGLNKGQPFEVNQIYFDELKRTHK